MTQEEKSLLLKDLSARLPYGVIVQVKDWTTLDAELKTGHIRLLQEDKIELKPYLRPMSSMTEEEEKEICQSMKDYNLLPGPNRAGVFCGEIVDWLNSHHFDYRGLIEKGLVIEVTEDNNPYET